MIQFFSCVVSSPCCPWLLLIFFHLTFSYFIADKKSQHSCNRFLFLEFIFFIHLRKNIINHYRIMTNACLIEIYVKERFLFATNKFKDSQRLRADVWIDDSNFEMVDRALNTHSTIQFMHLFDLKQFQRWYLSHQSHWFEHWSTQ